MRLLPVPLRLLPRFCSAPWSALLSISLSGLRCAGGHRLNHTGNSAISSLVVRWGCRCCIDERKDLADLTFLLSEERIPVWWTQHPSDLPVLTGLVRRAENGPNGPPRRTGTGRSGAHIAGRHLRSRSEAIDAGIGRVQGDQLGEGSFRARSLFVRDDRNARSAVGAFDVYLRGGFLFRRGALPWTRHGHGGGGAGQRPRDRADGPSRVDIQIFGRPNRSRDNWFTRNPWSAGPSSAVLGDRFHFPLRPAFACLPEISATASRPQARRCGSPSAIGFSSRTTARRSGHFWPGAWAFALLGSGLLAS